MNCYFLFSFKEAFCYLKGKYRWIQNENEAFSKCVDDLRVGTVILSMTS